MKITFQKNYILDTGLHFTYSMHGLCINSPGQLIKVKSSAEITFMKMLAVQFSLSVFHLTPQKSVEVWLVWRTQDKQKTCQENEDSPSTGE